MATFRLTEYGKTALLAAMAGSTTITITNVKTSDVTTFTSDEYPDFTNTVQSVLPSAIALKTDVGTALVTAVFSNSNLTSAYSIKAVGLYAKCSGSYVMNTPRLYGYCILDSADSMPLPTSEPISYTYLINTKVSEASAITVEMTEGAYAAASDFSELTNLVHTNEANNLTIRLNATVESSERAGYNWLQEVSVQGMTADFWPDGFISSGSYNSVWTIETAADKLRLWFVTKPSTSAYVKIAYMKTYS